MSVLGSDKALQVLQDKTLIDPSHVTAEQTGVLPEGLSRDCKTATEVSEVSFRDLGCNYLPRFLLSNLMTNFK